MLNRRLFSLTLASSTAHFCSGASYAQTAHSMEQARLLVGFPPGGATDVMARLLADGLRGSYARSVIVENKPGAAGRVAPAELKRAPADGSVLLMQPEGILTMVEYIDPKSVSFKIEDFEPIAPVGVVHHAFAVGPAVPESVRTMRDFLAWAQANPGKGNFGTPGQNSAPDLLMRCAGAAFTNVLTSTPYRGSAPALQDLLGGQISGCCTAIGDCLPHLASGRLRLLGSSGPRRSTFVPELATFAEQGFEQLTLAEYFGVWATAGMARSARDRAAAAISAFVKQPRAIEGLAKIGVEPAQISPDEFGQAIRASHADWGKRLRAIGFKPES